ncbi:hypothetical protein Q1695_012414 [Nippostrongylus brasiliensis]|nr:hypothetical protein Q1695_012414 [Nippostrongylus brasiliensis]
MSALYCEPKLRDFGLVNPGWRGFGGILTDPTTSTYIPQHNLAAFWKRPIAPIIAGYVEPILPPSLLQELPKRPPGSFRCDLNSNALMNMNLLAASRRATNELVLWRIAEWSNQHIIDEFKVEVEDAILSSEGKVRRRVDVGDPVLELRLTEVNEESIWTRCKRHLSVVNPSSGEIEKIFRSSVRCFEENVLLPGDITLCDMNGMVWSGPIGSPLSRTKSSSTDIKLITHSDHPRVIFASSSHEVRTFDLRLDSASGATVLFDVPEFSKKGRLDRAGYVPEEAAERPSICHIRSLPERRHNFLVVTTHCAHLCDDRFAKEAVLALHHTIPYGAHSLVVTPPMVDVQGSGHLISAYFLDHLLTDISVLRIYNHDCQLWSSVMPIQCLGSCSDFGKAMKPSQRLHCTRPSFDPTMGMAIVQGYVDCCQRPVEFLVRSLSDGSVWYQTMRYGKIQGGEVKKLWSLSRQRLEESMNIAAMTGDCFSKLLPASVRQPSRSLCTTVDVNLECRDVPEPREVDYPQKEICPGCEPLQLLQPSHPDAVLPSVIDRCVGFAPNVAEEWTSGNLAQTYSALLCLAILGDDFKHVDREAILRTLTVSQKDDGSFWSEGRDSESDMRFVFCAVAICHILQDFSCINFSSLKSFIRSSLNYDGGIGQGPGDESHGGSTFCAIASLSLANRLWDGSVLSRKEIDRLVKWALWKQDEGFHGRAHKADDSCYAFWIGATLEILNANHLMEKDKLRAFLLTAQHQFMGGFCKIPEESGFPDLLHTYFSIAAFSLLREPGFAPINASLNVSRHVYEKMVRSKE